VTPDRLLLIGATGFAGWHLADAAESAGMEVVRAARRASDQVDVRCDLLDRRSVEAAVANTSPELIANLAGSASVAASFRDPAAAFQSNATGTLNLLEATARLAPGAHVLCVSSGDVYGAAEEPELPFTEASPVRPISPYGASKAAMEVVCGAYARASGLDIGIVRAFNHTGPGQSEAFAASSFARQIAEAERGDAREVVLATGDLSVRRDFSDVRDIARAYVAVAQRRLTGTYNACSGQARPVSDLIGLLGDATSLRVRAEVDPDRLRPGEPPVVYGSPASLSSATEWHPEIPLEGTLRDLLDWWRERIRR
jgi:GDP-4-dehydro-6-deoxy-D-mannose reductase